MNKHHILLTGLPGSGKTTLVRKIVEELQAKQIRLEGFYTEELRNERNQRIGFDVVDLRGSRRRLARIGERRARDERQLGRYVVHVDDFEHIALECFKHANAAQLFIVDEIGKMELFSSKFKHKIVDLFDNCGDLRILATVPLKPLPLIDDLKKNPSCKLITVDQNNRNTLFGEIIALLDVN